MYGQCGMKQAATAHMASVIRISWKIVFQQFGFNVFQLITTFSYYGNLSQLFEYFVFDYFSICIVNQKSHPEKIPRFKKPDGNKSVLVASLWFNSFI